MPATHKSTTAIIRMCECGATINLSSSGFCSKCNRNYWASPQGRAEYDMERSPTQKFDEVEKKLNKGWTVKGVIKLFSFEKLENLFKERKMR